MRRLSQRIVLALISIACTAACGPEGDDSNEHPREGDAALFLAVPRSPTAATLSLRSNALARSGAPETTDVTGDRDFYIAISRRALTETWFLSAYLKQYFPGALNAGAAQPLGTRVVALREQNDKLFVFDVDQRKTTSDVFDPEVVVDAYPIVRDPALFGLPGADDYILIDPAAGLNRLSAVTNQFGATPAKFTVDVAFSQRFRPLQDGVAFEEVFMGYSALARAPDPTVTIETPPLEPDSFRGSGVIGYSLRRYTEGAGYVPTPLPEKEYYFRGAPHLVSNTGATAQVATKWNVHPGMRPIPWVISKSVTKYKGDSKYKDYDVYGALKRGVEAWNDVFGFRVLEARLATDDETFSDNDLNYVLWDADPTTGFARADMRTNPNTGEILGASIYFGSAFLTKPVEASRAKAEAAMLPHPAPELRSLVADAFATDPLCVRWAPGFDGGPTPVSLSANSAGVTPAGAAKEKIEQYLSNTIMHEIGHTLGLRHNFKGSLMAPSSSIMDYLSFEDDIQLQAPGAYDDAAIRYLYGFSKNAPTQPFCTDEATLTDAECARFDSHADPLHEFVEPQYQMIMRFYFGAMRKGVERSLIERIVDTLGLEPLLAFVRVGKSPEVRLDAFHMAMGAVGVPLNQGKRADAVYAAAADRWAIWILKTLYAIDTEASDASVSKLRGTIYGEPPANDITLGAAVISQAKGIVVNEDGIRSFESRRAAVDVLKKMQTSAALTALLDAHEALGGWRNASGTNAAEFGDLVTRIDGALHPYFTK